MSPTPASPTDTLVTRILPEAEWPRLLAFSPFREHGLPDAPEHWRMIVAEVNGTIVGFCTLSTRVHWDWELGPSAQKHPGIIRGLIRQTIGCLQESGIRGVCAIVTDMQPEQQAIVERFGFEPVAGQLYLFPVPQETV